MTALLLSFPPSCFGNMCGPTSRKKMQKVNFSCVSLLFVFCVVQLCVVGDTEFAYLQEIPVGACIFIH